MSGNNNNNNNDNDNNSNEEQEESLHAEEFASGNAAAAADAPPPVKTQENLDLEEDETTLLLLQEAFGVTRTGTCIRHPNCPVVFGLTKKKNDDGPALPQTQNPTRVVPCRVCFSEEKSVGIRQGKTFATVVQELQTRADTDSLQQAAASGNMNLSSSSLFQNSLSQIGGVCGSNSNNSNHSQQDKNNFNASMASINSTESTYNTATNVLLFLQQERNAMESVMKRLTQVQNWMLRQKEKEVLSLQLHIHRLEQRLQEEQKLHQEQRNTVKALRKTIQQDLKIIKTMATQKQIADEQQEAALAILQKQSPLDLSGHSPALQQQRSPPKRTTTPHHLVTAAVLSSTTTTPGSRYSPSKMRKGPGGGMDALSIPEEQEQHHAAAVMVEPPLPQEEEAANVGPNKQQQPLQRQQQRMPPQPMPPRSNPQYWNEADLKNMKASKIFQSFRGGLLDIPKSPPRARHDREAGEGGGAGGASQRKKLQLKSSDMDALKLPERALSRSNSNAVPGAAAQPPGGPSSAQPPPPPPQENAVSKEIPLDLLVAKLSNLPVQRKIQGQSPEQFFGNEKNITRNACMPAAPSLGSPAPPSAARSEDEPQESEDEEEELTPLETEGGAAIVDDNATAITEASSDKFVFSVTGACCRDKFGDEGTYTGTILVTEGLPHGVGKMDYESGRVYEGEWVSGQWHGKGKLLNPNGDTYEGEFFFDARHGNGLYRWDNGDVYVGQFSSDKRHGKGKFSFHNGNVYEGEFCDGMFDGFGRYEFAGGYYEGDWKEGRYNGAGELMYANGGKYTGEFRNSVAHGFGMEVMPDGRKRRGVWTDGKPTEYFDKNS